MREECKIMAIADKVPATVYELLQQSARCFGECTALTYLKEVSPKISDEKLSYSELLKNVNRVVRLINGHLEHADGSPIVTSFLLPNIPQTNYILWGAETAGIANPLNPMLSDNALIALMDTAKTDILFALGPNPDSNIWEKAQAVVDRLSKKTILISVNFPDLDSECHKHFDTLLPEYSDSPLSMDELPQGSDIAAYFHTGGTTGAPKLAMLTHTNQVCTAEGYRQAMGGEIGDVGINGLPLFHVAGSLVQGLGSIAAGMDVV
ncbi:MAG: AMP-binding protein, partial [Gammaproteobacteria bacterium]